MVCFPEKPHRQDGLCDRSQIQTGLDLCWLDVSGSAQISVLSQLSALVLCVIERILIDEIP
jgi:hypothetical protein